MADGLRRGDPDALRRIHAEIGPSVAGYLRGVFRDPMTAEDVFQQVMTEVWRRGRTFDPERGTLTAWVMTIARSRAVDELRRHRPAPVDPADVADDRAVGEDEADRLAERWSLAALLDQLPADDTELLRLRFWSELSLSEISALTGVPLGTVKTRSVRALERLRELVDEDAGLRTAAIVRGEVVA